MACNRSQRFVIVGDSHGDMVDPGAASAFRQFSKAFKPTIRIHLGDAFDLRWARKGADDDERDERPDDDEEAGLKFLADMAPTHFLRGNHDERLWDIRERRDGPRASLANRIISRIQSTLGRSCQILPYDKVRGVLRLSHLKVLHGYCHGESAAKTIANSYGSAIFGHIHSINEYAASSIDRRVARSIGCMCKRDMKYLRATVGGMKHALGWGYGMLHDDGTYHFFQAEGVGDRFVYAETLKEAV